MSEVTATFPDDNTDAVSQPSVPKESAFTLMRRLGALLFVAPAPVHLGELARSLQVPEAQIQEALPLLEETLERAGLIVQRLGEKLQLGTAPDLAGDVERFLGLDLSGKLSPAALETLAIVAYKQPVTRAEIEAIRGVSSDGVLRSLLTKGLIEEVGRKETVGRPILYGTSMAFLQYFGLRDISELPPLEDFIVQAQTIEQALQNAEEGHTGG